MSLRNTLNSNMWQLVSPDTNQEPNLIFNRYIPIPNSTQVGGVRPDNITIAIDPAGVITAISNGTIGSGQFIPYISFISSATASANQTFTSNLFNYYRGNASFASVSVDGAVLQPNTDYLISTNSITILAWLLPNSLVEVQAKMVPVSTGSDTFITTEAGDTLTTQAGDIITIQEQF